MGSNQKSPERQINIAIKSLGFIPCTAVTKVSTLIWSKAWGLKTQQNFCNAIVEVSTRLTPELLLNWCQKIETRQGRVRRKHWGPRVIDIDIILFAQRSIKTPKLTIPHPHYLNRDFVISPLREIRDGLPGAVDNSLF